MRRLYIKLNWLLYKNKLNKLSDKKLIRLWNLFDYYDETENELRVVSKKLNIRFNGK